MTAARARHEIVTAGERLGFRRVRVTEVVALERGPFLDAWLAEGRAGDMRYLLHHRKARVDPRTRYPWARSVVSAFFPYRPPASPSCDWRRELRGRIAAYALGADYHDVVAERLRQWSDAVRAAVPGTEVRSFVDTGAVLEHEWALRSGVGWTGKHTLTLSEEEGSYGFLAELLVGIELPPDEPVAERCGTCTRCLDVCPWNGTAAAEPDPELAPDLREILDLDERAFDARYGASAVRRTGRIGLARNAAVVLGNSDNPAAADALGRALREHHAALVRGHAAWALGRLAAVAPVARTALERARNDPDAFVRDEVAAALAAIE
jgi:epoxyqueuosine reductase